MSKWIGGESTLLNRSLQTVVDQGFSISDDFAILAKFGISDTNATRANFQDDTGFECFINHLHLADYVEVDQQVGQGGLFVKLIFEHWRSHAPDGCLNAIVGIDSSGDVVIRFHRRRANESWLSEDIDGYEEAVMEMTSLDAPF
jgi:hypothetical protein